MLLRSYGAEVPSRDEGRNTLEGYSLEYWGSVIQLVVRVSIPLEKFLFQNTIHFLLGAVLKIYKAHYMVFFIDIICISPYDQVIKKTC